MITYIKYEVKVYSDGTKEWYLNGELHREDGPAIELSNGTKEWYLNGKRHREDGPAIEWPDGTKQWYINGKRQLREESSRTRKVSGLCKFLNNVGERSKYD